MNDSRTIADAMRLCGEGSRHLEDRRFSEAQVDFTRATEILENLGQTRDRSYAECLLGWAESLRLSGAYAKSLERFERAAAAWEEQQQTQDRRYAECLCGWADSSRLSGTYALAVEQFERAATALEEQNTTNDRLYAECLYGWAESLRLSGTYAVAVEYFARAAAAFEGQHGTQDCSYGACLFGWADSLRVSGTHALAVEQFERAAAALEVQNQTNHRIYAYCLYGWADSLRLSGAGTQAVAKYEPAVAAFEAQRLTLDRLYADSLLFWAESLRMSGAYSLAVPRFEQAAAAFVAQQLTTNPKYADCLVGWASSLEMSGAFSLAIARYEQAAAAFEVQQLTNHPIYAYCLLGWANSLEMSGAFILAVARYEQAAAAYKTQKATDGHNYIECLVGCARPFWRLGAYTLAVPRYQQATAALEAQKLTLDSRYSDCLLGWADSLRLSLAYPLAVALFQQAAAALEEQQLTHDHRYCESLFGWAIALLGDRQLDQAIGRFAAAAEACLETQAEVHPIHARILRHMASCCVILGSPEHAWEALLEALMREDFLMVDAFRGMTPEQRYDWLRTASCDALLTLVLETAAAPAAVSLAATGIMASANQGIQALTHAYQIKSGRVPLVAERAGLALDQLLRRKGLMTESLARQRERARRQLPQLLRPLMEQLTSLWRQLLKKRFAAPGRAASAEVREEYTRELAMLEGRAKYLEDKLRPTGALASEDLEALLVKVGRSAVAEALPAGACLVEFVQYSTSDFLLNPAGDKGKQNPGNYAVFVLHAGRAEDVFLKRVGLASEINPLVLDWQRQLEESEDQFYLRLEGDPEAVFRSLGREQNHRDFREVFAEANAARLKEREVVRQRLSAMIWGPVADALGQATQVFIAPDGELNKLPFELLPGSMGGYLGDELAISYLSSGRDLIRWGRPVAGPAGPSAVVVAPDFDLGGAVDAPMPRLTIGAQEVTAWDDFDPKTLESLPGALEGGKRTAIRLGVSVTEGGECLKEKVLGLSSPRVLSLGTHGFVLRHVPLPMPVETEGGFKSQPMRLSAFPNPLFRCGIAMAGCRTFLEGRPTPPGAGIGLILGVEITEMDLSGTELVSVEVCRAGDGEALPGDGVMGLRHAFILAGARSLVMPWWSVNDVGTAVLMDRFWHHLETGMSRLESLREARKYVRESPAVELRAKYRSLVERAPFSEDFKERFEQEANWRPFEDPSYWGGYFLHGSPGPMMHHQTSGTE